MKYVLFLCNFFQTKANVRFFFSKLNDIYILFSTFIALTLNLCKTWYWTDSEVFECHQNNAKRLILLFVFLPVFFFLSKGTLCILLVFIYILLIFNGCVLSIYRAVFYSLLFLHVGPYFNIFSIHVMFVVTGIASGCVWFIVDIFFFDPEQNIFDNKIYVIKHLGFVTYLAHLNQRLNWAFVITCFP